MGSTCASFHVLWRGSSADAAKAIVRAYAKLGYVRTEKPPAEGGRQVLLLARPGERFVSVYDSGNASLDSGELKDAALAASKLLKTGAVATSLYDSDRYEFVVFSNGKQADAAMTGVESYDGPLKRLTSTARARQWSAIFGQPLTADAVTRAASVKTAFADHTLAALSEAAGLPPDRPLQHFRDVAAVQGPEVVPLYFMRAAVPVAQGEPGQIALRDIFDRHNSRKLLVYPASWPMPPGEEQILTWLALNEGAGFGGGAVEFEITGPAGLTAVKAGIAGFKFHNGQIVGNVELPPGAAPGAQTAVPDIPIAGEQRLRGEFPGLAVPAMTPSRTTQILLVLQLHVLAAVEGSWEIRAALEPGAGGQVRHALPPVCIAAVAQDWVPVVSGLNPKAVYDEARRPEPDLPDAMLDRLAAQRQQYRRPPLPPEAARAEFDAGRQQSSERHYQTWRSEIQHRRQRMLSARELQHPAIASNVAILEGGGQALLNVCRGYMESWLRPLAGKGGELRLRAERQMTESFHVGKVKKDMPLASALSGKAWAKCFDESQDYQAVVAEIVPDGALFPIAGTAVYASLSNRRYAAPGTEAEVADYQEHLTALTLGAMRGRAFEAVPHGDTLNVCNWAIDHASCFGYLETSGEDMRRRLGAFVAEHAPLQAWHARSAWVPVFDLAGDYEDTIYEDSSVLNFFRGVLHVNPCGLKDRRMTAQWCRNVLRMVAPHLWLGAALAAQVDRAALEQVAHVSEIAGGLKLEKRPGVAMDAFELALLPVLPVESVRTGVV